MEIRPCTTLLIPVHLSLGLSLQYISISFDNRKHFLLSETFPGVEANVLKLLSCGSDIAIKNGRGERAIDLIQPSTLEKFFDLSLQQSQQCWKYGRDAKFRGENDVITFDYSSLIPHRR